MVQEWIDEWQETLRIERRLAPITVRHYNRKVRAVLSDVDDLTALGIKRAINRVAEARGWCAGTVYQTVAAVHSLLRFCCERGYITEMEIPFPKVPERLPRPIPRNHLRILLETPVASYSPPYFTERDEIMFRVMLYCGLRVGELVGLDCTDCDLSQNTLLVRNAKGSTERVVPLIDALADRLYEYLLARARFHSVREPPAMFLSRVRARITPQSARRAFQRHLETCGLTGYGYTPHSLRHSFATLLIEGGAGIRALQELLGHKKIENTLLYIKVTTEHIRQEVNKHPLAGML